MSLMGEYIGRRLSAADLEKELLFRIRQYNKYRGTYLIVYAAAIGKQISALSLDMDDYYLVADMLRGKQLRKLDFYVETPGGSAEAAEEMIKFIRKDSEGVEISFVVSGEAKSAGTILVLGGDEILMTKTGSLGPIDAQVKIGRSVISAYDYMDWLKEVSDKAKDQKSLALEEIAIISQISPGEIKHVENARDYARDLVSSWLAAYKFRNWHVTETRRLPVDDGMRRERAEAIAGELVNHKRWRTHGRSLKIEDLQGLGLRVTAVDDDQELADCVYRIQTVLRLLLQSTTTYKVLATESEKIMKQAVPMAALGAPGPGHSAAPAAQLEIRCPQCGKVHKFYGKFAADPAVDRAMQSQGLKPIPKESKLVCECGYQIDLMGPINSIETKARRKLIVNGG